MWERGQLAGIQVSARCVKNRVAPPLGETELEIRYPLGLRALTDFVSGVHEVPDRNLVQEVAEFTSAAV